MRPTLRRDDTFMVTVRVQHILTSVEMAEALCWDLYMGTDERDLPTLTRSQAEEHIRAVLSRHGSDGLGGHLADEVHECGPDEHTEARARRAVTTVRRFWPDLDDARLREFETDYAGKRGEQ